MRGYTALTRRHCNVFLKDRAAVAFSLLSMFIVLMLMVVFLGKMNTDAVAELLAQYGGSRDTEADQANAACLVQYWTLAGIMEVNAVTVPLAVIGIMVKDAEDSRLESFYCAPIGRRAMSLAYMTAACLAGTLFCILTVAAGLAYICLTGGSLLPASDLAQMLLHMFVNVCLFSVIMYLAASFIKSSSAWSAMATIVGTLVGFAGAVYIPMGTLPQGVSKVLSYTPVLHGASLMRQSCCEESLIQTFAGMPKELIAEYKEQMGISVTMGEHTVNSGFQMLLLCAFALAAMCVVIWREKRTGAGNR